MSGREREKERTHVCKLHVHVLVHVHVHVCCVVVASNLHLITHVMFTLYMPGISPGPMTKTVSLGMSIHTHPIIMIRLSVCIIYTDIL